MERIVTDLVKSVRTRTDCVDGTDRSWTRYGHGTPYERTALHAPRLSEDCNEVCHGEPLTTVALRNIISSPVNSSSLSLETHFLISHQACRPFESQFLFRTVVKSLSAVNGVNTGDGFHGRMCPFSQPYEWVRTAVCAQNFSPVLTTFAPAPPPSF